MSYRTSVAAVLFGLGLLTFAGCGGSGNPGGSGNGGSGATTPTVTVSPASPSITLAQSLTVTVTVSGSSGAPSGSVTLTSGSYSSGTVPLSNGSTLITVPAGSLATGTDTLTASYASSNSSVYNNTFGTTQVMVASGTSLITPTITVWPFPWSIATSQSLGVTIIVNTGRGNRGATGTVRLTSGNYDSGAVLLNASEALITIPAGSLATGMDTLTATYTPDGNSSSVYNGATGTAAVNVTASLGTTTPSMTITPDPSNITLAESTTITISMGAVNGNPTPTGSVILTGPNYYSSGFVTLSNGSAQITVKGSTLGDGTIPLTVTYAPDANSSSIYTSGMENFSVIVSSGSLLSPTVTVSNLPAVTDAQPLTVTVTVDGGNGNPAPTGSVVLSSGAYTSSAAALVNGSAQITIPAGTLQVAAANLTASYTPDAGSSSIYTSALGTGSVYVTSSTHPAPTVSVSVNPSTIGTSGTPATITVTVSGGSGNPVPTGTVTLTSGSLTPQETTLTNGSVQFILSGAALAVGTDTLDATYIPDPNSFSTYSSASGMASVTVVP